MAIAYDLPINIFTALIYSESSFKRNKRHALSYVYGLGGINVRAHPQYKQLASTWKGNLEASAIELSDHYAHSYNWLHALTLYKGFSSLGLRQAQHTLSIAQFL